MLRREIIENGVRVIVPLFGKISGSAPCKVVAEVTIRPGSHKRETRIFIRDLDTKGMSVSDAVLLMATMRTVIEKAGKIVEEVKATQPRKRQGQSAKRKRVKK